METNLSSPLPLAPDKTLLKVVTISGKPETIKRLSSMGIHINSLIQITQKTTDNLVIAIDNTRLAIGFGIAQKIMVSPYIAQD